MRALGYPRLISLENFRSPNFELVADCLHWLIQRFYPECAIADDIGTEAQRVAFLQAVAGVTAAKARMRLNLRRLYAADGAAVRELLKLASLLHRATRSAETGEEESQEAADPATALRLFDAAGAAAAASEVARCGVALHDGLLAEAGALREARARAIAAAHDTSAVEAGIQETIAGLADALAGLRAKAAEAGASEAALAARVDKRRGELERAEKRLATLAGVRPAYMDEHDALTAQLQARMGSRGRCHRRSCCSRHAGPLLVAARTRRRALPPPTPAPSRRPPRPAPAWQVLWLHYLERHRNLQYLEAQLDGYHRAEQADADAAERRRRKMQRRLAEEELRILRGEAAVDEARLGGASSDDNGGTDSADDSVATRSDTGGRRGGGAPGRRPPAAGQAGAKRQSLVQPAKRPDAGQVVGSLAPPGGWEEEDDDSIDDDTASDGGDVSRLGSDRSDGGDAGGRGGGFGGLAGGAGQLTDSGGGGGPPESEDSGF
ncbi:cluap1 [Scenedesmus sp. PABB004]|nr:cluap1 [Scenedesmus sp. PABB004]